MYVPLKIFKLYNMYIEIHTQMSVIINWFINMWMDVEHLYFLNLHAQLSGTHFTLAVIKYILMVEINFFMILIIQILS